MFLTFESIVVRTDGLMSGSLDDSLVILNPLRDNYVELDEIGRRVWELLESPMAVGQICERIAEEFAGDPGQIADDLLGFLKELMDERLVHVAEGRSGKAEPNQQR